MCADWEAEAAARRASSGVRVVQVRTGVVLDRDGGALAKMLPPFRLGVGGPVAGGRQYISWIHREDLVGMMLAALDGRALERADQRDRARAGHQPRLLARRSAGVLRRPVAAAGARRSRCALLYGEMAEIVTTGARVMPAKALVLGYEFRHPRLEEALRSALARG